MSHKEAPLFTLVAQEAPILASWFLSFCVIIDGPHCTRILHSVNVYYIYVLHSDIVLRKRRLVNLRAVHTCISWS